MMMMKQSGNVISNSLLLYYYYIYYDDSLRMNYFGDFFIISFWLFVIINSANKHSC